MVSASNRIVTAPRKAKGRYEKAHFCIHSYDIDDNASEAPPASVAQDGAPESHMTEKDIREAGFVIDIFGAPLVSLEFIYTTTYFLIMLHGLTFPVWFIDLPSQYGSWTYHPSMVHGLTFPLCFLTCPIKKFILYRFEPKKSQNGPQTGAQSQLRHHFTPNNSTIMYLRFCWPLPMVEPWMG